MRTRSFILLNFLNFSPAKIQALLNYFKNPEEIFSAKADDFKEISLLTAENINNILSLRSSSLIDKELDNARRNKVEIIDLYSKDYPSLLKEISFPPLILYIQGDKDVLKNINMAVVGTRTPTVYGITMARKFSYQLASLGLTIVSGGAVGIDTYAHQGALEAGGKTIVVLGSGLLNIYPPSNKKLFRQVSKQGLLISEFPLAYPPRKENFPRRNRIISGLAKGVLVVEAAQRSGSLITANYALEQNREVFALPGKVNSPFSFGTHSLIKEGAALATGVEDIIKGLNLDLKLFSREQNNLNLSGQERKIFDIIEKEERNIEEIILLSGLSQAQVFEAVISLQVKRLIRETAPSVYIGNIER